MHCFLIFKNYSIDNLYLLGIMKIKKMEIILVVKMNSIINITFTT